MSLKGPTNEELQLEVADLRRQLEELTTSETHCRSMFMSTKEAIVVVGPKGRILEANPALADMLGYDSRDELVNVRVPDVWLDRTSRSRVLNELRTCGYASGVEATLIKKDGSAIDILGSGTMEFDARGKIVRAIGFFHDVTERRLMQEAVRWREAKLQSIFRCSPDAIIVTDPDTVIVECNRTALKLLGCRDRSQLIGKNGLDLVCDADRPVATHNLELLNSTETRFNVDLRLRGLDGREFPGEVSASQLRDSRGSPMGLVAVMRDISERKSAEEVLRWERNRLEMVTESIGAGMAVIDRNWRIVWANGVMRRMFGDIRGELCHEALQQRDRPCADCCPAHVFETGQERMRRAWTALSADGNVYTGAQVTLPVADDSGEVRRVLQLLFPDPHGDATTGEPKTSPYVEQLLMHRLQELDRIKGELVDFVARRRTPPIVPPESWLSMDELTAYLGVKRDTVYKWIRRKEMPAHKVGWLWKFRRSEIDAWLERAQPGRPPG